MFNKFFKFVLIVLSITLLNFNAFAASKVVEDLQNKYMSMDGMQANLIQTLIHKDSGVEEERSGNMKFKKPYLLNWQTTNPEKELLFINEKNVIDVFVDDNVAYIYPLSVVEDSKNILGVITGKANLTQDFIIDSETQDGEFVKIDLLPKELSQSLVEATIWVNSQDSLIYKAKVIDFYGNQNIISFKDIKINPRLSKKDFNYKIPRTMTIEDRSDEKVLQKPLLN